MIDMSLLPERSAAIHAFPILFFEQRKNFFTYGQCDTLTLALCDISS
jgi:hypothetical protein